MSGADGDRSAEALIVAASRLAAARPASSGRKRKVAIAVCAAIVLAVIGFVVLQSKNDDQPPAGAKVPLPGLVEVSVLSSEPPDPPISEPLPTVVPSTNVPTGSTDPSTSESPALSETATTLSAVPQTPSSVSSENADLSAAPTNYAVYKDGVLILTGSVATAEDAAAVRSKAEAVLPPERIQGQLLVDPTAGGPSGIVRAELGVLFDSNSSRIKPNFYADLDLVVAVLNLTPAASVEIHGYTDSSGTPEFNLELASRRVFAITDYLLSQGIAAERVIGIPHGEADPVGDNSTIEGRAMNRRIDVIFRDLFN